MLLENLKKHKSQIELYSVLFLMKEKRTLGVKQL
jgi:hypothetical protein